MRKDMVGKVGKADKRWEGPGGAGRARRAGVYVGKNGSVSTPSTDHRPASHLPIWPNRIRTITVRSASIRGAGGGGHVAVFFVYFIFLTRIRIRVLSFHFGGFEKTDS